MPTIKETMTIRLRNGIIAIVNVVISASPGSRQFCATRTVKPSKMLTRFFPSFICETLQGTNTNVNSNNIGKLQIKYKIATFNVARTHIFSNLTRRPLLVLDRTRRRHYAYDDVLRK